MTPPLLYGLAVFAVALFVGWITGLGGAPLANLGFSALMGALAAFLFRAAQKQAKRKQD